MRLAAEALIVDTPAIQPYLPQIYSEWKSAPAGEQKLDLSLLLAWGDLRVRDAQGLKEVSAEILSKYPDSFTAIRLAGDADGLLKDWKDWNSMLDERIAKRSDDEDLLHQKVFLQQLEGDFAAARRTEQKIIDMGKGTSEDYNDYAWTALSDGKVDADITKAAQQAVLLSKSESFAELHTLACIYAYQGKTAEARDLLLKAMGTVNQAVPNPEVWFALAMIYEKYGLDQAAIEAYNKVEKPDDALVVGSTYELAQKRLLALRNAQPSRTSLAQR